MQIPTKWVDFELLDTGDGMKLERWGQYLISRPEPRAIWSKSAPHLWKEADAYYEGADWKFRNQPPTPWEIRYVFEKKSEILFALKPTDFKHTGVFPEQAANWEWIREKLMGKKSADGTAPKVLNLFAYTGGSTMAAALAGAQVTHVDASRPAMMWASENAKNSQISKEQIRWIQDDAMKFVQREIKRGTMYDAIIMDPPRFGRGAGGEVWKLEEHLPKLVHEAKKILSPTPLFFLINAYTADLSHLAIKYVLEDAVKDLNVTVESGEIGLPITASGRQLPAGIFARF